MINPVDHPWVNVTNLWFWNFSILSLTSVIHVFISCFILSFSLDKWNTVNEAWACQTAVILQAQGPWDESSWVLAIGIAWPLISSVPTCRHCTQQGWAYSGTGWIAGCSILPLLALIWFRYTLPEELQWPLMACSAGPCKHQLILVFSQVYWSYFESCLGSQGQVRCDVVWGLILEAI